MTDDSDNIIRVDFKVSRPKPGDPPIRVEHRGDAPCCAHEYVAIYPNARRVFCRVCKLDVDPLDVLLVLSRQWDWATHWAKEIEERRAFVEKLKAEEQRVKARLKRLGVKTFRVIGKGGPRPVFEENARLRGLSEDEGSDP